MLRRRRGEWSPYPLSVHMPCQTRRGSPKRQGMLLLDPVLLELPPERGAPDPERIRRSRVIPTVPLQNLGDMGALRFGERLLGGQSGGRPKGKARVHMGRQVAGLDRLVSREDGGPLHRVLEFAHIAGPG